MALAKHYVDGVSGLKEDAVTQSRAHAATNPVTKLEAMLTILDQVPGRVTLKVSSEVKPTLKTHHC
ncbi:hypothetical protein D3C76_360470 [compost metagenome]